MCFVSSAVLKSPHYAKPRTGAGYREIYGNSGNCIDEQVVLNACSLSVSDNAFSEITAYPNPVKDLLHFSKEVRKITVTDLTGKVLVTQSNSSQIDIQTSKTEFI